MGVPPITLSVPVRPCAGVRVKTRTFFWAEGTPPLPGVQPSSEVGSNWRVRIGYGACWSVATSLDVSLFFPER